MDWITDWLKQGLIDTIMDNFAGAFDYANQQVGEMLIQLIITPNKTDKDTGEVIGSVDLEIRAYHITEPKGNTKGYASVTIDGMFGAHGISIIEGKNGLFMSMPQTRDSKGDYRDYSTRSRLMAGKRYRTRCWLSSVPRSTQWLRRRSPPMEKLRASSAAAKEKSAPAAAKDPKDKKKSGRSIDVRSLSDGGTSRKWHLI